jgi:tartrate-resistant acid phosphatase type 5
MHISSSFKTFLGILVLTCFLSCHTHQNILDHRPNNDSDSLSFIVMGDWGKDGNASQLSVAKEMDSIAKLFHVSFIITTGDNFYPNGVASTEDMHWQNSFEKVYNKPGEMVTWYPALGNHDYETNPQAEISYSGVDRRWNLPSRYYTIEKNINSRNAVLFVFTDTSPFIDSYYSYGHYPDIRLQDTASQLRWLQNTLAVSSDRWKIAIGHHPVFSTGVHSNTPELIAKFRPVFDQTHTDFYLCGHDHSLQSIERPDDPVHYLISGGGSEHTSVFPTMYSPFSLSSLGFLVMTLYPDKANYYFVNDQGTILYQHQVLK